MLCGGRDEWFPWLIVQTLLRVRGSFKMSSGRKRGLPTSFTCEECGFPALSERSLSIHSNNCSGRQETRDELLNRARQTQAAKRLKQLEISDSGEEGSARSQGSGSGTCLDENNSDQVCGFLTFA